MLSLYIMLAITGTVRTLPHCSRTSMVTGQVQSVQLDTGQATVVINSAAQTLLSMGETACFFVEVDGSSGFNQTDSSDGYNITLMHAIHYERTHQLYPVREQYTFAIPQLQSECICDCPGGDDHCTVGYAHTNCTKSQDYCVRSYHAHQPSTGCQLAGEADQCCEVTAIVHNDWKFVAVYLGQPLTVATFRYHMLKKQNHRWETVQDELFEVVLTTQPQRVRVAKDSIEVQLNGAKSNWQLKEGMYFYKTGDQEITLRHGVPINRFHEYSVNKLGWFRWQEDEKRWAIRNGRIKLQAAHFLHTVNCQNQDYAETFNADFYATASGSDDDQSSFFLGHPVQNAEKWIGDVRLVDRSSVSRQIAVLQTESSPVQLTVSFNGTASFTLYHHGSELTDFTGTVRLDSNSNRFLNMSLVKAKGTLIGEVFDSNLEEKMDLVFSACVGSDRLVNVSMLIGVPASVNASKWVCLQPHERPELKKCRWVSYVSEPLPSLEAPHKWVQAQGHCIDCNQLSPSNFLSYLNPANWIKGVNAWPEALAVGLEVTFYALVALIVTAVCRRFLCPVLKWSICSSTDSNKPSARPS